MNRLESRFKLMLFHQFLNKTLILLQQLVKINLFKHIHNSKVQLLCLKPLNCLLFNQRFSLLSSNQSLSHRLCICYPKILFHPKILNHKQFIQHLLNLTKPNKQSNPLTNLYLKILLIYNPSH